MTELFICVFIPFFGHIVKLGNTSPKATGKGLHCSESPLTGFSTPKCPPIKDVIEV
jgi:hypothetical protein